jgi:glycosyltransferase involved in cell wall biosynthesis
VLFRIIAARLRTKSPVLYYPPASPNMVPFLRDCVLLICMRWMFPRTVFHFHANGIAGLYGRLPGVLKLAFRAAYMRPDIAIAISEYGKADGVFLNAREIRLIPNGIPDQAGNGGKEDGRLELEVGDDGKAFDVRRSTLDSAAPKILFVGMVCEEKGVGVLLEACRILRDRGVRFACEVVGRASSAVEEQSFRDFIRDHDLGEQVTLTGPLHHEAKWQAYAAADVFCFPTFYSAESFGLVAVEAMMSGLPVVSTNWSGLPDIVVEGETGYLAPPRDAAAVADHLELLIKDPELRKRMGAAGRKRYEENYTVETFREKMEEVLEWRAEKQDETSSQEGGQSYESASVGTPLRALTFSIITPSLNQLDWLRVCVASVADQVGAQEDGWRMEDGGWRTKSKDQGRQPRLWEESRKTETKSQPEGRHRLPEGKWHQSSAGREGEGAVTDAKQRPGQQKVGSSESNHLCTFTPSNIPTDRLAIEHIIQDGGTPGIEEFAKEMGEELMLRYGGELVSDLQTFELLHFRTASGYTLRVFKEPDSGMYDAINKGIARTSGDLWAWINSDEQYLPGTLVYVTEWFARHPEADILCGDALLLDEGEHALSYRRTVAPEWLHTRLAHLSNASCASFYRKSVIERTGVFDTAWRSIGDAEWMARLMKKGMKIKNCRKLLASYAFTGVNTSATLGAFAEGRRWLEMPDAPPAWLRLPVVLVHRLKKLMAGSYRKRMVTYALYEKGSKTRVTRTVTGLGWSWRGPTTRS